MSTVVEPAVDEPGPPVDDDGPDDESWWHSGWRLAVLGVALLFLGFAAGFALTNRPNDSPGAGSVDVGFLQDMRYHHDNAVRTAFVYLQKPVDEQDPALRTIAGEILLGQQLESGKMVQLLRDFGQPEANTSGTAMTWMGMNVPPERMPGIVADDQLQQLADATGTDADLIFLRLMRAHHEGGLHMGDYAVANAKDSKVRELASAIVSSQRDEITELDRIEARLSA
jgi:uncharacterized protein (DUF305 family)